MMHTLTIVEPIWPMLQNVLKTLLPIYPFTIFYPHILVFYELHRLVKTPRGAADRDFVVYMKHGVDENGVTYVMYKNATHPMKSEVPGVVR